MLVIRSVTRGFPARAFEFAPSLGSARLAPSAPFSGVGVFRRALAPSRRWSGDLAVDLPGRANVDLTGSDFRAHIAHARIFHEAPHLTD